MLKQFFALSAVIAVFSGCATINKQEYAQEIEIRSLPSNATLELVDHTSGERNIHNDYIRFCCYKGKVVPSIRKRRKVELLLLYQK